MTRDFSYAADFKMADLEQQHPMLFNKFIELMNQDQAKDLVRGINMCVLSPASLATGTP